jgi:hypothetical protein
MPYKIKNWNKHQHFKDRRPPWVKLYRDILDNPDWHELSGDDAKLLVSLWLIASEDESKSGLLPDTKRIAFRMRTSEKLIKQQLTRLTEWVYQDDITVISERYQLDAPETETETENRDKGRDRKTQHSRFDARLFLSGQQVEEKLIDDWTTLRRAKKLPITETAINGITREATKAGLSLADALTVCCERGWGGFKAEWLASDKGSKKDDVAWWGSEPLILAKGREVNLEPRPGESIHEFKGRVVDKLRSAA